MSTPPSSPPLAAQRESRPAHTLVRLLGCQPEDLPTLPAIALELGRLAADPDSTVEQMVEVIKTDPPLAARLLRVANSPLYRGTQPVISLERAVLVLGFDQVSRLALGLSLLWSAGGRKPLQRRLLNLNLWRHSVAAGVCCEILARDYLGWGEGYYVHGLLHDLGKLTLEAFRPEAFDEVVRLLTKEGLSWREAELRTMELDHAHLSALLLDFWGLPEPLCLAVGGHHEPWEAEEEARTAGLVALGNHAAHALGFRSFDRGLEDDPAGYPTQELQNYWAKQGWTLEEFLRQGLREKVLATRDLIENLGAG
ncbi:MAG: HDOD domain-containing protein [Deltaproteobacteria bacterium]|nr:HDOD domain-containing protein [Deltaproteobacteria bacterium]